MIIPNAEPLTQEEEEKWTPDALKAIAAQAGQAPEMDIGDHKHRFTTYERCFVGTTFVKWLVESGHAREEDQATRLAGAMYNQGLLIHVLRDHHFKNERLFYRFTKDHRDQGHGVEGQSWADLDELMDKELTSSLLVEALKERSNLMTNNEGSHIPDMLFDKESIEMYDNVRPRNWVDPDTSKDATYDMVVIGGGAAGMVTSASAAVFGAKACMIERGFVGGDCLVTGCVPSKAFLKACSVAHSIKNAADYGLIIEGEMKVDFPALMTRMKKIRAEISKGDAAGKFAKYYGMDIFLGHAKFLSQDTVSVNGKALKFRKACIASGARPLIPDYPGLKDIHYYTSDNIFNLTEQPKRMLVVGGGPIGSELGQGFARLGTEVSIMMRGDQFLPNDDADAVKYLQDQMEKDGVKMLFQSVISRVEKASEDGRSARVTYRTKEAEVTEEFDAVLLATGRTPNVENMDLEKAGVKYGPKGIEVNENLQTANKNVYACGDCIPGPKFTHNSDV